jgi:hypothetical protein
MATQRTFLEALQLFDEKAALIQQRSFIQDMLKGGTGYSIRFHGNQVEFEGRHPDPEAVEAATVTCRYFLEPRDGCSFRQLSAGYADPQNQVSQALRVAFKEHFDEVMAFLAKASAIDGLSNEDLLYTIVYGEIAHSNHDKHAVVAGWKQAGLLFEVAWAEALKIMALVIVKAVDVKAINEATLAALPA